MKRIRLGPFNRVEGDLEITLDSEAGAVLAARVNSPLFRGFEQILVGRSPEDTLRVVDALQTDELCACNRPVGGDVLAA